MNDNVTLTVNGLDFKGFTSVSISAGVLRQCRSFSLTTTWQWPGQDVAFPIRSGDRVEVRIGDDLVLTGYVDSTPISYDASQITRTIAGRSLTADLVDCSAKIQSWTSQTVGFLVSAIAQEYGVSVVAQADVSKQIPEHSVDPGESAFRSIDRLLQLSRLLSTDDERGRLVLAGVGAGGRAVDKIKLGENVVSARAGLDFSHCYSTYEVLGQQASDDLMSAEAVAGVNGQATDRRVSRHRKLITQLSGQVTPEIAKERAVWERESRASKALAVEYTLCGWRQSTGELWKPNTVVRVEDKLLGLNRDMLIVEVEYSLSSGGLMSHLSLMPPEGLEPEPKEPKASEDFEYLLAEDWEKNSEQS